jgi:preprotein translocase SecE subunit
MADKKKNISAEKAGEKSKNSENFFVKIWKKLVKLYKDTIGELKKVSWTSKTEVIKSFKLVIATVVGVSLVIAAIDFGSSLIINTIANLIG